MGQKVTYEDTDKRYADERKRRENEDYIRKLQKWGEELLKPFFPFNRAAVESRKTRERIEGK